VHPTNKIPFINIDNNFIKHYKNMKKWPLARRAPALAFLVFIPVGYIEYGGGERGAQVPGGET